MKHTYHEVIVLHVEDDLFQDEYLRYMVVNHQNPLHFDSIQVIMVDQLRMILN